MPSVVERLLLNGERARFFCFQFRSLRAVFFFFFPYVGRFVWQYAKRSYGRSPHVTRVAYENFANVDDWEMPVDLRAIIKMSTFLSLAILARRSIGVKEQEEMYVKPFSGITLQVKLTDQTAFLCMGHLLPNPEGNRSASIHALTSASCLKRGNIDYVIVSIKIVELRPRCAKRVPGLIFRSEGGRERRQFEKI